VTEGWWKPNKEKRHIYNIFHTEYEDKESKDEDMGGV